MWRVRRSRQAVVGAVGVGVGWWLVLFGRSSLDPWLVVVVDAWWMCHTGHMGRLAWDGHRSS